MGGSGRESLSFSSLPDQEAALPPALTHRQIQTHLPYCDGMKCACSYEENHASPPSSRRKADFLYFLLQPTRSTATCLSPHTSTAICPSYKKNSLTNLRLSSFFPFQHEKLHTEFLSPHLFLFWQGLVNAWVGHDSDPDPSPPPDTHWISGLPGSTQPLLQACFQVYGTCLKL